MGQNDMLQIIVLQFFQQKFWWFIWKVAGSAFYPLLQGPGIGAVGQHFRIMIGLEDQSGTIFQMLLHHVGGNPQIGGNADFDATQVDPATISLDGQGVGIVGKGKTQAHIEDVNNDGLDDLMMQIEDVDGTYELGDTIATLTGETFAGIQIVGTDSICIRP